MRRVFLHFDTDLGAALRSIPGSLGFVFIGMLLLDAAFILVSASQDFQGVRTSLHVSVDNGFAEHWQYVKWGLLAVLLSLNSLTRRAPVYFAWGLLFLYFLIDDSQQIHETYGAMIATAFELRPAFGLRAQDFGELTVTAIAAGPIFATLALAYFFGSGSSGRVFTRTMILLVIALACFGVGVDMLDILAPWQWLRTVLNLVEDGGEMIVATFMVAYAVGALVQTRHPAPAYGWRP